jgi:hypothetical protein
MSDWKMTGALTFNQGIDETSTTQNAKIGTIVTAVDIATTDYGMGEFIYLKGVASTVATDMVTYNAGGVTARSVANAVGMCAFAMSACVASQFGWYQISGRAVGTGNTSDAANLQVYIHATAGSISDGIVAGDAVEGAVTYSALDTPSSGKIEISINRPYVNNISN